ncbi:MAG TPA: methionine adenosyltransferase [Acidimicrobiia bacterium]|nr:methionine adenosyltransferase [Acidimicrobiia bacterium]
MRRWFFASESVTEGHPDKVADAVSDSVLDAVLTQDPEGRVACETLVTTGMAVVAGELNTTASIEPEKVAREAIADIGYVGDAEFSAHSIDVTVLVHQQSPDIAAGVNRAEEARLGSTDLYDILGAGDQGIMFGFAVDETPELMPLPIQLAHRLAERLAEVRRLGTLSYLRPDGKTQVMVEYEDRRPVRVASVLISAHHGPGVDLEGEMRTELWEQVVVPSIPESLLDQKAVFYVNPSGRFEVGGPHADTGLTGRKIIVDTYGGYARHGGGAFSGKDPTKVDRSATYAARHAAKNVVAAGLARRCEVQLAYAIGRAAPFSIHVDTFGTSEIPPERLEGLVADFFDFRPQAIIDRLDLRRPIYRPTAAYGHFGRLDFPWESTALATELSRAASSL